MERTKSLLCLTFLISYLLLNFHSQNGLVIAQKVASSESEALGNGIQGREALEIIIGGGGSPAPSPSPSPEVQTPCPPPPPKPLSRLAKARTVLLNFVKTINDPKGYTSNWCPENTNTCNFNGIRCATYPDKNRETAVAGIDLNTAGIYGRNNKPLSLSGILDKIPELTFFHVNSNNFSGAVPKEIIKYPYFFELDLSNNKIVGGFPQEVLQNNQLVFLDLRFNNLYGEVPPNLFKMDLDVIFINNNRFSSCLPETFGNTPARYLTFANNQFTGPIPRSIGNASNTLTEVLFLGNKFDGCLPYEIGYLKKATVFDVSKNSLTGPIPYSFGCLSKIQFLNLASNKFYGPIPDNICTLPGIRQNGNLTLSNNYFTELGPECRKLIKSKVIDVSNNCIPGLPNQRSHQECYQFLYSVKPCPNEKFLKSFCPCQGHFQKNNEDAASPPPEPVTYKSLKPHRLRL